MTPAQFSQEVRDILEKYGSDPEAYHSYTDDLMEDTLTSLGYQEGVDLLNTGRRWYA